MALGLTPEQIIAKNTHPLLRISKRWSRVKMKHIAFVQNGYAYSSKYFNHDEGLPLIRIRDIDKTRTENLYSGDYSEEYIVNNQDILIGMDGDFKVSKWPGKKGLLNQRVCKINHYSKLYNRGFLFLCLQPYLNAINEETSSITVKHLSSKTINEIPLPLPPLPEQRAIVAKIEQLFSELDNGIANLKKAKEKLEIYRQAVLKKAFEGELTNTNNIEWVTLDEVCDDVEYGTSSKSKDKGLVPVLRMGNIQNGQINWEDLKFTSDKEEIKKYRLNNGDVLFNRTNSPEHVGKTAIFKGEREAIFAGYLIRIHYDKGIVNGYYLNYFMNCHIAKKYGNKVKSFGVNQSNINGTKLKSYPFPNISLEEQERIVKEIETRLSVCDSVLANINEGLEKAEALRQSILKKAFAGSLLSEVELEVCRREPDWEPAEKLLERIKNKKDEEVTT